MSERAHVAALAKERAGLWSAWTSDEGRLAWRYLRPHWQRLVSVVAMAFASSGLELIRMGFVLAFLGAAPAWLTAQLPNAFTHQGVLLGGIIVASLVAAGWDWWRRHVALEVQRDFIEALRADVCLTMLHRPLDWFTANPAGQASYLLNGQVQRFGTLVPMASEAAAAILQGAAVVALMLWTSVPLTAIALSGSALLWAILRPLQHRIRALSVQASVDSGKAAEKAEECAYAIKLIKSCRTEEYERDRYATLARELAQKQVWLADLRNLASGLTMIGFVGILGAAVWAATNTTMLAAFGILLLRLYPCLSKMIEARTSLATMAGHMAAVAEFMTQDHSLSAWAEREKRRASGPTVVLLENIKALSIEHLKSFYSPEKVVLDDVSFTVVAGEAVAIVGLTGSGKTTLMDILAGIRPHAFGRVAKYGPSSYLPQESILLFGTVGENINYPYRSLLAFPHTELPFPCSQSVGRAGSALSGGQRQLVAMERLFAGRNPVWLLDEPTSAMDADTERKVMDYLLSQKKDHIILVATHRLHAIKNFDRILVLHGGKIVQDGTHGQLVKEDGLYQRLWRLQEVT